METKRVVVLPYDDVWHSDFLKIKEEIEDILGNLVITVEHIGSTSVPGLAAKPIIDLDVVIRDWEQFSEIVERLEASGYHHEGDLGIPGREAFCYENKPHFRTHHLYVCSEDSRELHRHIVFRDYLRAHPKVAKKYGKVKMSAAALFPDDVSKYMQYKSACIKEIYALCGLE